MTVPKPTIQPDFETKTIAELETLTTTWLAEIEKIDLQLRMKSEEYANGEYHRSGLDYHVWRRKALYARRKFMDMYRPARAVLKRKRIEERHERIVASRTCPHCGLPIDGALDG